MDCVPENASGSKLHQHFFFAVVVTFEKQKKTKN